MSTQPELLAVMTAIAAGYKTEGLNDRYVVVDNPDFVEDDGSNPKLVFDTWEMRAPAQCAPQPSGEPVAPSGFILLPIEPTAMMALRGYQSADIFEPGDYFGDYLDAAELPKELAPTHKFDEDERGWMIAAAVYRGCVAGYQETLRRLAIDPTDKVATGWNGPMNRPDLRITPAPATPPAVSCPAREALEELRDFLRREAKKTDTCYTCYTDQAAYIAGRLDAALSLPAAGGEASKREAEIVERCAKIADQCKEDAHEIYGAAESVGAEMAAHRIRASLRKDG